MAYCMAFHNPGYFPDPLGVTSAALTTELAVNSTAATTPPGYSLTEVILIAIVAGMLSLITVVGNVMVMISFKMDKQLQTISNYFLLSLAIADFLIGLISMPLFTMYLLYEKWPLGPLICDTWLAIDYLNSNASVLNLLVISFDRYFSVTRPLTYRVRRTTRRAAFMIACAWIISLVLWPPWIYSWPYIEGKRTVPEEECYIQFLQTNSYLTFGTAIAAFYVPVTVMCVLYWRVWKETEQRKKDLTQLQAEQRKEGSKKSTSSDDPAEIEDQQKRNRSASCVMEEGRRPPVAQPEDEDDEEATYVLPVRQYVRRKPRRLKEILLSWCRVPAERDDEDSTDHGSPVTTPASAETSLQPVSRNTSMNFNPPNKPEPPIPLMDRNGPRKSNEAGPSTSSKSPSTKRSISSDSVYTILIKLPSVPRDDQFDHSTNVPSTTSEGVSQASIKMILEEDDDNDDDDDDEDEAETSLQTTRMKPSLSSGALSAVHGSLRASVPSSLEAIRLPLNPKLIAKPITKMRAPKKKRKQQEKKQEKKAAKTLSAILLAFIITWTPYNVLVLIKTVSQCESDKCIPQGLWNFSYYLCYINSLVNPLCYALCNANFRRTYIRILSLLQEHNTLPEKWNTYGIYRRHSQDHGFLQSNNNEQTPFLGEEMARLPLYLGAIFIILGIKNILKSYLIKKDKRITKFVQEYPPIITLLPKDHCFAIPKKNAEDSKRDFNKKKHPKVIPIFQEDSPKNPEFSWKMTAVIFYLIIRLLIYEMVPNILDVANSLRGCRHYPKTSFPVVQRFKEGREETADNERSGRPSTSTTPEKMDKVLELVREVRRITVRDILGVRRLNAFLVPKDLTFDQKNARKETASLNLEATTDDPELLKRVITGDETWIYGFDSETTQQSSEWRFKNEPRPKKARKAPSKVKVMLTVFFDYQSIVHHEFRQQGLQ
ncbi:CHRM5 [Cordylochernes scorpioides]|uniref:CHRM5 n=1 Tax=Cordylochernes scorpioides TaxID=51811 RepID=A0ABY6L3E3_9ARAC|nr:CHRM5 [Cordylochernes scorpioides]